jgi:hypothetical protein
MNLCPSCRFGRLLMSFAPQKRDTKKWPRSALFDFRWNSHVFSRRLSTGIFFSLRVAKWGGSSLQNRLVIRELFPGQRVWKVEKGCEGSLKTFWLTKLSNPQTTDMRLSCFASTNTWFVTRESPKVGSLLFRDSSEFKILISSSYFTASQNGTTRQTGESWCLRRFCIPFSKTGFTG